MYIIDSWPIKLDHLPVGHCKSTVKEKVEDIFLCPCVAHYTCVAIINMEMFSSEHIPRV